MNNRDRESSNESFLIIEESDDVGDVGLNEGREPGNIYSTSGDNGKQVGLGEARRKGKH